jgi:AraC-like DNA-binding protein
MNRHFRFSNSKFRKMEELGVPALAVLQRAGLSQALASQGRVTLTTEQFFSLWRSVAELSSNPMVGVLLGSESRTERFDPISLVALSTESFGAAVEKMSRYKQLTCPEQIRQQTSGEEWSIQFDWLLADRAEPAVLVECCFAWVLSVARQGTGTHLSPLRLDLRQPRAHVSALERHFGCPIVCGAARNAIVFRAADAQRPFLTRNAELLSLLAPQFEQELTGNQAEDNFLDRVRTAVQQKLTGRRPTVDDIADTLHISSRTLQRRLQEAGSSFQRVLEDARHQLALNYLNNSALELNEAAYLLGYEDANSFVRAFRTWEGIPPARWRQQQRAAVTA